LFPAAGGFLRAWKKEKVGEFTVKHLKPVLKKVFKKVFAALVALLFVAIGAGALYQRISSWQDARRFTQQGKSIALGPEFPGVALNMDCSGAGSPTVILESGLGVPAIGWYQVQPEIAKLTRVCSYDRAGYGWSTPGPMPRTSDQVVKELHALLAQSGEKGPYILVAHSFGGYNMRVFTQRYPEQVAGLVLVDCSHEDQLSRMPPSLQKFMTEENAKLKTAMRWAPLMIHSGFARLTSPLDTPAILPLEKRKEFQYLELQTKFVAATSSEMLSFEDSAAQVSHAGNLGERPLIVLIAGKTTEEGLPPTLDKKEMADFHDMWVKDLQVREARLSTQGKQIVVPDSDHIIPFEQPQSIIDATHEIIDAVRATTDLPETSAHR